MAKDDELIIREQIRRIIEESTLSEDAFSAAGIAPMPSFSRTSKALGQLGDVAKVGTQKLALQGAKVAGSLALQLIHLGSPQKAQEYREKMRSALSKAQTELLPKEKSAWKSVTDNLGSMGGDAWILTMALAPGPMLGALAVKTGAGLSYNVLNNLTGGGLETLVTSAGAKWDEVADKVYGRSEASSQKLSELVVQGQTPRILKFLEASAAIAGLASIQGDKFTGSNLAKLKEESEKFFGIYDRQKTDVIAAKKGVEAAEAQYSAISQQLSKITDKNSPEYKKLEVQLDLCKYGVAHEYFNLLAATGTGFQDQLKNVRGKIGEVNKVATNVDKYTQIFASKTQEFLKLLLDAQKKLESLSKTQTK